MILRPKSADQSTTGPRSARMILSEVRHKPTYTIEIVESRTAGGKVDSKPLIQFETYSPVDAARFLNAHGIDNGEIDVALTQMEQHGHNVANFGWFGRFIFSEFKGAIH